VAVSVLGRGLISQQIISIVKLGYYNIQVVSK